MWVEGGASAGDNPLLNFTLHKDGVSGNMAMVDGHAEVKSDKEVQPKDFGLTTSNGTYGGQITDTYVEISAGPTLGYAADLTNR